MLYSYGYYQSFITSKVLSSDLVSRWDPSDVDKKYHGSNNDCAMKFFQHNQKFITIQQQNTVEMDLYIIPSKRYKAIK